MDPSLIWIPTTLLASVGQVTRNAMQRRLTERIGTLGATQVRFLYGFPFSLVFLAAALAIAGEPLPRGGAVFAAYLVLGSLTQIGGTALMLAAMRDRSFSVVTALLKTEPIQIAIFGLLVLGDRLSLPGTAAIVVATAGVALVSGTGRAGAALDRSGMGPALLGVGAGALFALSAVGFRGAILALDSGSFLPRASTALAASLFLQSVILILWLVAFDHAALLGSFREWRSSILAGFVGAAASQLWFIGFALTAAANVRTLGLVEVVLAMILTRTVLRQRSSAREIGGVVLIVGGVLVLLGCEL